MSKSNIYVGVAGFIGRPNAKGSVGIFRRPVEGEQWEHVYEIRKSRDTCIETIAWLNQKKKRK